MASVYDAVAEEFLDELSAIEFIVESLVNSRSAPNKARNAGANSSVLLLAASFEEFVREMARVYARSVVRDISVDDKIFRRMTEIVWRRTMVTLSKRKIGFQNSSLSEAQRVFESTFRFCSGQLGEEVYDSLVYNENNMRPSELNSLFKIFGLKNICKEICNQESILDFFSEESPSISYDLFLERMNGFFETRNQTAHSLGLMRSVGSDQVLKEIKFFQAVATALAEALNNLDSGARPTIFPEA